MSKSIGLGILAAAMLAAASARASDGVIEINQACAEVSGCNGEGPGFPVTLSRVGSYRLTSDLVVTDPNVMGIVIAAGFVTLDLNGFEVRGPVTCTGTPPVCTAAGGTAHGIYTQPSFEGIEIKNGSVTGFQNGLWLEGPYGSVHGVSVRANASDGVVFWTAAFGSRITRSSSSGNAGSGIDQNPAGGYVLACEALENGNNGIASESMVLDSAARNNGGNGIGANDLAAGNASTGNGTNGIFLNDHALVLSNDVTANGSVGIYTSVPSAHTAVNGNAVRSNGSVGIFFPNATAGAYRDNTITDNGSPLSLGNGVDRAGNYCAGPGTVGPTCP
jgi:hypothetical protein